LPLLTSTLPPLPLCIHRRRHHHERRFHRCRCRLRVDSCCIPRRCLCFRRHADSSSLDRRACL
jgi:hypothetical protein